MTDKIFIYLKKLRREEISLQEWWDFIASIEDKVFLTERIKRFSLIEERLKSFHNSFAYRTRIRKFCNYKCGSDVHPYEVIRVISDKLVEVREMEVKLLQAPELLGVGGFAGVYENYSQKWECVSNENYRTQKIRLSKNGWGLGHFKMADKPINFYDYNF